MTVVEVDAKAIPDELKERDQWLLWDAGHDTPRQPHWDGDFYGISWSDPDDWHSFEEAVEAAEQTESWGIGYVMAQDNDAHARGLYSCLDLDGCLDPEPDEPKPKNWLPSLADFIDDGAYIEVSPSGDGLHIPLVGQDAPDWWSDSHFSAEEHEGVEYLTNKFVTFTGDTLHDDYNTVASTDPTDFLFRSYTELNGENPRVEPSDAAREHSHDGDELSKEQIEDALSHINSSCAYPQWRDIGFAIHDWDSSSTGKSVFESWSRGSGWDEQSQRYVDSIWQNASQGDGVTVGTLIHHATENGWTPPNSGGTTAFPDDHDRRDSNSGSEDSDEETDSESPDWGYVRHMYEDYGNQEGRLAAANALDDMTSWMFVLESETLWVYDDESGFFNPWGEQHVSQVLERELGAHHSTAERDQVVAKIQARHQTHREDLNAGAQDGMWLCVGNGVVNLEDGTKKEHSPKYRFTRGLQWDYEPAKADPDPVLEFLDEVTKREADRDTILDHLAHGLMPGHPYRAFVMTYGPGSNGKTKVGKLIQGFVGEDNAASVELQDLSGDDNFATGALPGAFVNVGDDISVSEIRDASLLKSLTGDGTMRANEKHEKMFDFKNEAAMFFSANEPPRFSEDSDAIADRLYPIEMPYRFVDDNEYNPDNPQHKRKVPGIAESLLDDEQAMQGLLLLCIKHAQELIESKGQYSMPEGPRERRQLYEAASDPIKRFALNHLDHGTGDDLIIKEDAWAVYREMCEADNERVASEDVFKEQVSKLATMDVESTRTRNMTPGDDRDRCWRYVSFNDEAREIMPPRLQERYFGDDDESPEAATEDAEDVAYGADTIASCAHTLTGYVTVTAKVLAANDIGETGVKLVLEDKSGAIDMVAWDEDTADILREHEGETIVVKNAEVSEYDGTRQLSVADGVTAVDTIQQGVGHTTTDDEAGANTLSSSQTAATDGGADSEADQDEEDDVSNQDEAEDSGFDRADSQLVDVPTDAVGPNAHAKRIAQYVTEKSPTPEPVLKATLSTDIGLLTPDEFETGLAYGLENGLLQQEDNKIAPAE
jgi:putative DNA primase/helicase